MSSVNRLFQQGNGLTIEQCILVMWLKQIRCVENSLVPRHHPLRAKGSGDSWVFTLFLQAQHSCFCASQSDCSSTIFMHLNVVQGQLSCFGINQSECSSTICIPLHSNVHTGHADHATITTKKLFQCHQTPFPCGDWGLGTRLHWKVSLLHTQLSVH